MRDLLNIIDSIISEATLSASQITKYPERFDAFITHIQDSKPFYTEKEGTAVILDPNEAERFLKLKNSGQFKGNLTGIDQEGNHWPLSSFRKTAEFGGASATPGADSTAELRKEGAQVKPSQINIVDKNIPASELIGVIVNNDVLQSTDYGSVVIEMAKSIAAGQPAILPPEFAKNEQIKKAIVDYAGEYLGVLALVYNQSNFPNRNEFLNWLGGDLKSLNLFFPSSVSNPLADSFASVTNTKTGHTINISSKGTGGGAPPSINSLKVPDHIKEKEQYETAVDIIELCQNENLPSPKTVSQVFQMMNLLYERMPNKVPKDFHPYLPWDKSIVDQVNNSRKNNTPMPKYAPLFEKLDSKGSDGGKLTYVTKIAVMNMVNGGAVPEFQAAVLEILDFNFIQQYAKAVKNTIVFETQWPAKLNGEVTMESKSGGTDPTKGGFSFKLKPKGAAAVPNMPAADADAAAVGREPSRVSADDLDKITAKRTSIKAANVEKPLGSEKSLGRKRRV
jgi:hypothetical protein